MSSEQHRPHFAVMAMTECEACPSQARPKGKRYNSSDMTQQCTVTQPSSTQELHKDPPVGC